MPRRFARLLPLLLLAAVTACNTAPTGVTSVEILGGDRSLEPGAETVLTAYVTASAGHATTVTWSSSDAAVAAVSNDGLVTAVAEGSATITATSVADTSKSDSITVSVEVDPAAPQTVDATYIGSDAMPPVLAVALYFEDTEPVAMPVSFTEVIDGLFLGPLSSIGADGTVELILPDTTDVPAQIMRTASDFVDITAAFADCELTASAAAVGVSFLGLELVLSNPGVAALTIEGAHPFLVTDAPLDPDEFTEEDLLSVGHPTWVYAAEAVSVEATGAGCTGGAEYLVLDLDLQAGWNQLTWDVEFDGVDVLGFTLRHSDGEAVFLVDAILN